MEHSYHRQLLRNARRCDHLLYVYEDEALQRTLQRFVFAGLERGGAVIVIATTEHLAALDAEAGGRGLPLERARHEGRFVALDAQETLDSFMVGDWPSAERFRSALTPVVQRVRGSAGARVRAYGEMVGLLLARGNEEATLRLEQLWTDFCRDHDLALLCGYPARLFDGREETRAIIQGEHTEALAG